MNDPLLVALAWLALFFVVALFAWAWLTETKSEREIRKHRKLLKRLDREARKRQAP